MRRSTDIIRNTALFFLAVMLQVSCLMEKEGPSAGRQNVMIEVSVSVGEEITKADPEDATAEEKVVNRLRVYAFYGDRLAGYAERGSTALGDPFYMDLELPESGVHGVDFYVIANEDEMAYENGTVQLSENMTKAELEAIRYTALVSRSALPMYCKLSEQIDVDAVSATANTEAGHEGHFILNQKINFELGRSLAKISFYAAKIAGAATTPQIMGITLLKGGTRHYSYLFEQNESVLNAITPRVNDRALHSLQTAVTAEISKGSTDIGNPSKYTPVMDKAYLPEVLEGSSEWNISSENDRAAVLLVEYALDENAEYRYARIYLPPIVRNTHYKICVLINAEGQITVTYIVADWEDNSVMISFDYPNHSYIRESIPTSAADLETVPSASAKMSETQPFKGYFQMLSPDSDSWTPTIYGAYASDCTIKVYEVTAESDPGTPVTSFPVGADAEKWYRIEVTPDATSLSAGDQVKLSITYTATLTGLMEYLLVNGTKDKFYWPGSDDANYVIITMVN